MDPSRARQREIEPVDIDAVATSPPALCSAGVSWRDTLPKNTGHCLFGPTRRTGHLIAPLWDRRRQAVRSSLGCSSALIVVSGYMRVLPGWMKQVQNRPLAPNPCRRPLEASTPSPLATTPVQASPVQGVHR